MDATEDLKRWRIHPAAEWMPGMSPEEFEGLKHDIAEHGLLNPIVMWQEQILDGRHRLRACVELGVEPKFIDLPDDTDPYEYVFSHNLHRRHLDVSQRAILAARMANLKRGDNDHTREELPDGGSSVAEVASRVGVGARTVERAKQVIEHGAPALVEAVERGEIPVSFAARFVAEEPDPKTQAKLVKQGRQAMREHITPASPYVDPDDEQRECATKHIAKLWKTWSVTQRTAVRVWIDEHYLDN